jgi:substrate binding protein of glycine betaine ABC transport system
LPAILTLVLGALTLTALTGCGGLGQGKELKLANIGWDENVAVASLTKVLLEDELDYESVEIHTSQNLDSTYREVASGKKDAFQDVWLPNQEALLKKVAEDVEHLDPWFLGKTKQGVAVPTYMDVRSIDQLNDTSKRSFMARSTLVSPNSVLSNKNGLYTQNGLHTQYMGIAFLLMTTSRATTCLFEAKLRSSVVPSKHRTPEQDLPNKIPAKPLNLRQ